MSIQKVLDGRRASMEETGMDGDEHPKGARDQKMTPAAGYLRNAEPVESLTTQLGRDSMGTSVPLTTGIENIVGVAADAAAAIRRTRSWRNGRVTTIWSLTRARVSLIERKEECSENLALRTVPGLIYHSLWSERCRPWALPLGSYPPSAL